MWVPVGPDVRFGRRRYALVFGVLTSVAAWLGLLSIAEPAALAVHLIVGFLFANMSYNALGGWLGDVVPEGEGRLGTSFTIGNIDIDADEHEHGG